MEFLAQRDTVTRSIDIVGMSQLIARRDASLLLGFVAEEGVEVGGWTEEGEAAGKWSS